MERLSSYEADRLNDALYGMDKDGAAQAQVSARYVRTDKDGTPWVRFEGADKDTPLTSAMSVMAREGDLIDVRLGGYEATGGGNRTDPSASSEKVVKVEARAIDAQAEAVRARTAAETAEQDAQRAHDAADSAQASAEVASDSAESAYTAAGNALAQLSTVEDVVGALEWVTAHAQYEETGDTSPADGKWYFTRSGSGTEADPYVYAVAPVPEAYTATTDTSPVEDKTYYVADGSGGYEVADVSEGFEPGVTYYEASPGNPSALELYEVTSISESVQDYLTAHVAVTGDGLWVQGDTAGPRILLSPTGGVVLYAPGGSVAASYGQDTVIGDENGPHVRVTSTGIDFYAGAESDETRVGYIATADGESVFYMTRSVVVKDMQFGEGKWKWYKRDNGNMSLKWLGGA